VAFDALVAVQCHKGVAMVAANTEIEVRRSDNTLSFFNTQDPYGLVFLKNNHTGCVVETQLTLRVTLYLYLYI
jgi:hypothetical protein